MVCHLRSGSQPSLNGRLANISKCWRQESRSWKRKKTPPLEPSWLRPIRNLMFSYSLACPQLPLWPQERHWPGRGLTGIGSVTSFRQPEPGRPGRAPRPAGFPHCRCGAARRRRTMKPVRRPQFELVFYQKEVHGHLRLVIRPHRPRGFPFLDDNRAIRLDKAIRPAAKAQALRSERDPIERNRFTAARAATLTHAPAGQHEPQAQQQGQHRSHGDPPRRCHRHTTQSSTRITTMATTTSACPMPMEPPATSSAAAFRS